MAWIALFCFIVVALNIFATLKLNRSEMLTLAQRRIQAMIVWLLPVVGAITVVAVNRALDSAPGPSSETLHTPMSDGQAVDLVAAYRCSTSHDMTDGGSD